MFSNILVAVDGSAHGARAVAEAADLARSTHGRLTLLTVGTRPNVWPAPYTAIVSDEEIEDAARVVVDAAAAEVPEGVPVATVVRVGRPADEIMAQAKEGDNDLIVMGARGRSGATSLLLGSVSHALLNRSPDAVLIVHVESDGAAQQAGDGG
jgi:nucleotide-binding universal stress UspA family protein